MEIEEFAQLVQQQQEERHTGIRDYLKKKYSKTTVIVGRKYTKVDVGDSGKFMIDNNTGEIFGIRGYGQVNKHPLHCYGTLETVDEWYWGNYKPERKKQ